MDEDVKKLIEEDLKLNRENNVILKGIRGAQKRAMIYRFLYWILILGITFGAYYFVQPYVESLLGYYGSFTEGVDSVNKASSMSDLKQVKDLLQQLNQ